MRAVPHIKNEELTLIELDTEEWGALEHSLGRPIAEPLRERVLERISDFVHTLRLKEEVPSSRLYQGDLKARISEMEQAANNLLFMMLPSTPTGSESGPLSLAEFERLQGGKLDVRRAIAATRATKPDAKILDVADHIRLWLFQHFPEEFVAAKDGIEHLLQALNEIRKEVDGERELQSRAGRRGHPELKLLLCEVLQIAKEAGDDLRLPANDIRDHEMRAEVTTHPAYDFALKIIELIKEASPSLVDEIEQDEERRNTFRKALQEYLEKRPGGFIDALYEARAFVEGKRRR